MTRRSSLCAGACLVASCVWACGDSDDAFSSGGGSGGAAGGGSSASGGSGGGSPSGGAGGRTQSGGAGGALPDGGTPDASGTGGRAPGAGGTSTGGSGTDAQAPGCGDGNLDIARGEECDDGDRDNSDGCDDQCQLEPVGQTCGDGARDPLEKCDDANTANGDGCSSTCNLTGTVTTLETGISGGTLAVDDDSIWIGSCTDCTIQRIDLAACLGSGQCTPQVVAGTSCGSTPADGQGTNAVLGCVGSLTSDGSTLWFSDGHTIRSMSTTTSDVSTLAGDRALCAAVDGTGSSALFHDIRGLTYSGGLVYLLDGCENVLRSFDPATNTVTTLAGQRNPDPSVPQTGGNQYQCPGAFSCVSPSPSDGNGTSAVFGSPRYMAADNSGHLYITDTNGVRLRTFDIATGDVGTLIGGVQGYVDGTGAAVQLERPRGVVSDGTSLYWGEQTLHTVRQVIIQSAEASTLVGVRGCPGGANGVGGDGTQDWTGQCGAQAVQGMARIDTPMGAMAYHFPSRSIFLLEQGRLRRIE